MKRLRMMATLALLAMAVTAASSSGQAIPFPNDFGPSSSDRQATAPYNYSVPYYLSLHDGRGRIVGYRLYYPGYAYFVGPPEYPNITGLPSNPETGTTPDLLRNYEVEEWTREDSLPRTRVSPNVAAIDVRVPANARLWFEGEETRQRGTQRFFESPPLEPGKEYAYQVKVEWTGPDGKKIERRQTIDVRAGAHVAVDLRNTKP